MRSGQHPEAQGGDPLLWGLASVGDAAGLLSPCMLGSLTYLPVEVCRPAARGSQPSAPCQDREVSPDKESGGGERPETPQLVILLLLLIAPRD